MKSKREKTWRSSDGKTLVECLETADEKGVNEYLLRPKKEVSEDER